LRSARDRPADDGRRVFQLWASFATGVALLSLSLASAIWLAVRLV
jgi:hypothetical protein